MKKIVAVFCLMLLFFNASFAQHYTHADTLRVSNGRGRSWWDATKYDLHVKFNLEDSTISGYNIISFKVLKPDSIMQIDLQEPMVIDSVVEVQNENSYPMNYIIIKAGKAIYKDGNAYFFKIFSGVENVTIYYHGKHRISKKAPWDGGVVWARDKQHNPWISIACQGLGASVWYPCKDYQGDEPDSAEMHITAPSDLISISNGRLRSKIDNNDGTSTYTWAVVNPINNYDFIPYIGKYTHFGEIYKGEKGNLTLDYWVLDSNLAKAKYNLQKNLKQLIKKSDGR